MNVQKRLTKHQNNKTGAGLAASAKSVVPTMVKIENEKLKTKNFLRNKIFTENIWLFQIYYLPLHRQTFKFKDYEV